MTSAFIEFSQNSHFLYTVITYSLHELMEVRNVNEMKLRHELKYMISYSDYCALKNRLKQIAKLDPHVGEQGYYKIRSLYFDNYRDKALREKIDGVNEREKFRIRYYNDDLCRITLEKKVKTHGMTKKYQTPITKEQCEQLVAGEIEFLKDSKDGLMLDLYANLKGIQLKPRVIVDYSREPYIYPMGNVRITFDFNIRTGLYCTDFLNPSVPTMVAGEPGTIILEVKFDEYLPEVIQMILELENVRVSAFSKYAAARIYG